MSFLILLISSFNCCAEFLPECGETYQLCGYIDAKTGQKVIDFKYNKTFPFFENYARVQKDGLYGYINSKKRFEINPKFELSSDFYQGLAEFVKDKKAGLINSAGDIVLQPRFARAIPFTENTILFKDGEFEYGNIDISNLALPSLRDNLEVELDQMGLSSGGFGIYNLKTKETFYGDLVLKVFEAKGIGLIWGKRDGEKLWGLLDSNGDWILSPVYTYVQTSVSGLAVVGDESRKRGLIDLSGKVIVPLEYDNIFYAGNNLYKVVKGSFSKNVSGFVKKDGQLIGGKLFNKITLQPDGKTFYLSQEDSCIDLEGKSVECKPNSLNKKTSSKTSSNATNKKKKSQFPLLECSGGLKIFKENRRWGLKAQDGRVIVKPEHEAISCYKNGVSWVPTKDAWCPLGPDGNRAHYFDCQEEYYPVNAFHQVPQSLSSNKFRSSVLWTRTYLEYAAGERSEAPKMVDP